MNTLSIDFSGARPKLLIRTKLETEVVAVLAGPVSTRVEEYALDHRTTEKHDRFKGDRLTKDHFLVICYCFAASLLRPLKPVVGGDVMREWFCLHRFAARQPDRARVLLCTRFPFNFWKTHPSAIIALHGIRGNKQGTGQGFKDFSLNLSHFDPDPSSLPGVLQYLRDETSDAAALPVEFREVGTRALDLEGDSEIVIFALNGSTVAQPSFNSGHKFNDLWWPKVAAAIENSEDADWDSVPFDELEKWIFRAYRSIAFQQRLRTLNQGLSVRNPLARARFFWLVGLLNSKMGKLVQAAALLGRCVQICEPQKGDPRFRSLYLSALGNIYRLASQNVALRPQEVVAQLDSGAAFISAESGDEEFVATFIWRRAILEGHRDVSRLLKNRRASNRARTFLPPPNAPLHAACQAGRSFAIRRRLYAAATS